MVRAMRRNSRALHQLFRLRWLLAAFLLSACVASVYAAGSVRVAPQSTRLESGAASTWTEWAVSTQSRSSVSLDAVIAKTEYASTRGALTSSTIGGLARKALRGGVYGAAIGLTMEGIIDGAGWAINELKDQVTTPGTQQQPLGEIDAYCITDAYEVGEFRCSPSPATLAPVAHRASTLADQPCTLHIYAAGYATQYRCPRKGEPNQYVYVTEGIVRKPTTGWTPKYHNDSHYEEPRTITDDELGEAIRQNPDAVSSLLTDPRTGRPIMTPELQQQGDDLKKRYEEREGYDPSDPSPLPNLDDDTANDDGSPWPSFCGWATTVCDFIEWFKTEPTDEEAPDVPWEEEEPADFEQSWSAGLGGGSCPSPVSFSVSLGGQSASPEFSFDGICQFGTTMRPVVIALAAIIAGFIIGGVRGTKDA